MCVNHHHYQQIINHCNKVAGWWIYEFCFNLHIRQYHQDPKTNQVGMEYFLGYSREKNNNFVTHISAVNPEDSFVSYKYYDGTVCDLTNNPRTTEVRIYCATDEKKQQLLVMGGYSSGKNTHFIGDIEEPSSCNYILKFYSSDLCKFEGYAKADDVVQKVQCIPQEQAATIAENEKLLDIITEDLSAV
jgi:protein OS-9